MKPEFDALSISLGVFVGSLVVIFLYAASIGYLSAIGGSQPSTLNLLPILLMAIPVVISGYGLLRLRGGNGANAK